MRPDATFKRAYNQCLGLLAEGEIGASLGSEHELARLLAISRTTVRKVIAELAAHGLLRIGAKRRKIIARRPDPSTSFPEAETAPVREIIARGFMSLVQQRDMRAGQLIRTTELARHCNVSASAVREYLADFAQYGLMERLPNGSWVFRGFDRDFARELSDMREMFELRAVDAFLRLPAHDPAWRRLRQLEEAHHRLLDNPALIVTGFSPVDHELHALLAASLRNRFIDRFQAIGSLIFHYHYLWRKDDEFERNSIALREHIALIAALLRRDADGARAMAMTHLRTVRSSLAAAVHRVSHPPN